jgi:hypothetical protein
MQPPAQAQHAGRLHGSDAAAACAQTPPRARAGAAGRRPRMQAACMTQPARGLRPGCRAATGPGRDDAVANFESL